MRSEWCDCSYANVDGTWHAQQCLAPAYSDCTRALLSSNSALASFRRISATVRCGHWHRGWCWLRAYTNCYSGPGLSALNDVVLMAYGGLTFRARTRLSPDVRGNILAASVPFLCAWWWLGWFHLSVVVLASIFLFVRRMLKHRRERNHRHYGHQ